MSNNNEIHIPASALVLCMIAITAFILFAFAGPLDTSPTQSYKVEQKQEK